MVIYVIYILIIQIINTTDTTGNTNGDINTGIARAPDNAVFELVRVGGYFMVTLNLVNTLDDGELIITIIL